MKGAVFFERDGILNLCAEVGGHQVPPRSLDEFRVNPAAGPLIRELKSAGFVVIGTTVQPGVARGDFTRNEMDLMHRVLRHQLPLDDLFHCCSDDPTHPCYKPEPGLFVEAAFKWGVDLDRSFVISDKWADARAAHVVGCTSVMVASPWVGDDHHDFVVPDLESAVRKVLQLHAAPQGVVAHG